ncbi:MAG: DUF4838 domain-containing protein [Oscillospiraceae bacterium]|nr:DUF4838 domain-containing protein [Oscillospiraceae bacterium]
MFIIHKLRADHVVDFAAEELKKYLRMMMPRCGEIAICYDPAAKEGFRLGLLEDFGLPCEAEDPFIDDLVHIDTDLEGGILAGSNPRSVLYAVYRYLKLNGCRWLYPGVDGEHIPMKDIAPQKYHHLASYRFRGHCNEGAEFQGCMLETIDFYAKQELNVYMIEFDNPYAYYDHYYSHLRNTANRPAEPVTPEQTLQWKRQCEAEISKRGLQFHDMGHGWTAEPFGISSCDGWASHDDVVLTEEQIGYLAQLKGVRGLYRGVALNTQICMSNPKARDVINDYIVEYAKKASNVGYLHVWLADSSRNHCECEECQKLRPSDYYVTMMNELDEKLEKAGLDTRIVFICYMDTLWAPLQEMVQNTKRFSMLYAPIHRSYCSSITEGEIPPAQEYVRNGWVAPPTADAHLALLRQWKKAWKGPTFGYEYHFWRHQFNDPSLLAISRRIYEDIRSLQYMGLDGYVEDGSQRSFFPSGLHMHVFAETLLNRDQDFDAIVEDYFVHAYGEDWSLAKKYFDRVGEAFDNPYLCGENSVNGVKGTVFRPAPGSFYNPAVAEKFAKAREIAANGRLIASTHKVMPTRPQVISWRLLQRHTELIEAIAAFMGDKCVGNDELAKKKFKAYTDRFGAYEIELERYYDHMLFCSTYSAKVNAPAQPE